ncbi:hypothetical protein ACFTSF_35360 [Kribbella sp. NPDC056951]|uniref:hypothetical protein n=1 Tax=Kribbella sp. NPDC056951 TaxID=3345978 RepID=UPI0036376CDE
MRQVGFELRPWEDGGTEFVPLVNGVSLVELIARYERGEGLDPAGGYSGQVLHTAAFSSLRKYLLGAPSTQYALLGCICGDTGCWPLQARIHADADTVTWDSFCQPHRPERDYSGFGPFVFDRSQYDKALQLLN